jgi:uncharacterized protein (TIGR00251 family)
MDLPFRKEKSRKTLEVRVQPRSTRTAIAGVEGEVVKVKLTAPPAGGEANRQLIALISKELKVPKSRIRIFRGEKSRNKVIEVLDE